MLMIDSILGDTQTTGTLVCDQRETTPRSPHVKQVNEDKICLKWNLTRSKLGVSCLEIIKFLHHDSLQSVINQFLGQGLY